MSLVRTLVAECDGRQHNFNPGWTKHPTVPCRNRVVLDPNRAVDIIDIINQLLTKKWSLEGSTRTYCPDCTRVREPDRNLRKERSSC